MCDGETHHPPGTRCLKGDLPAGSLLLKARLTCFDVFCAPCSLIDTLD